MGVGDGVGGGFGGEAVADEFAGVGDARAQEGHGGVPGEGKGDELVEKVAEEVAAMEVRGFVREDGLELGLGCVGEEGGGDEDDGGSEAESCWGADLIGDEQARGGEIEAGLGLLPEGLDLRG